MRSEDDEHSEEGNRMWSCWDKFQRCWNDKWKNKSIEQEMVETNGKWLEYAGEGIYQSRRAAARPFASAVKVLRRKIPAIARASDRDVTRALARALAEAELAYATKHNAACQSRAAAHVACAVEPRSEPIEVADAEEWMRLANEEAGERQPFFKV